MPATSRSITGCTRREGGGRNLGEACHIYDLFTLPDRRAQSIEVQAVGDPADDRLLRRTDNFVATIAFEDGSVATLTYTALGSPDHPKEQLEVFVDGKVIALDDYRTLTVTGASARRAARRASRRRVSARSWRRSSRAIRDGGEWPIPLWQQVQATEIALAVEDQLTGGA